MELTPEERQRIYLEEKARLEARKALGAPRRRVIWWLIATPIALFIAMLIGGYVLTEYNSVVGSTRTLSPPIVAKTQADVVRIVENADRNDAYSSALMERHGDVFTLEKSTKVQVMENDGGKCRIVVVEGPHRYDQGWVDATWLRSTPE